MHINVIFVNRTYDVDLDSSVQIKVLCETINHYCVKEVGK